MIVEVNVAGEILPRLYCRLAASLAGATTRACYYTGRMRFAALLAALLLAVVSASAADVSGTWTLSFNSPQGTAEGTLTLKQDGDQVTGTYKGPRNTAPVSGTVSGDDLKLTATLDAGGQSLKLAFTVKVAADKIDGLIDFAGQANIPFTGTRKK